ncbi:MAG: hypothetical protein ISS19_19340, partial [Bacteroidales bacterium]|nr:hypothetical protein [Bacteroidales bacterium]
QDINSTIIITLYKDSRTVLRLIDIAMLVHETRLESLSKKLNYYVRKKQLLNPRKGIYTKPDYNKEELACRLYTPSYISLDWVLQRAGILFQFNTTITVVSYLSRQVKIESQELRYRKIKGDVLANTIGINRLPNHINRATPERAFLDMLYLNPDFYFDNINPLQKTTLLELMLIYQSKSLEQRVPKLIRNG